jgi:hypothetical protein
MPPLLPDIIETINRALTGSGSMSAKTLDERKKTIKEKKKRPDMFNVLFDGG